MGTLLLLICVHGYITRETCMPEATLTKPPPAETADQKYWREHPYYTPRRTMQDKLDEIIDKLDDLESKE